MRNVSHVWWAQIWISLVGDSAMSLDGTASVVSYRVMHSHEVEKTCDTFCSRQRIHRSNTFVVSQITLENYRTSNKLQQHDLTTAIIKWHTFPSRASKRYHSMIWSVREAKNHCSYFSLDLSLVRCCERRQTALRSFEWQTWRNPSSMIHCSLAYTCSFQVRNLEMFCANARIEISGRLLNLM